jgi:hypothetical protein
MAQSDGNLNVRTDGLRPSVQNQKKADRQRQTNRNTENLGVIHLKELKTDGQSDGNLNGRTDFVRPYGTKKMTDKQRQTETQENLGGKYI